MLRKLLTVQQICRLSIERNRVAQMYQTDDGITEPLVIQIAIPDEDDQDVAPSSPIVGPNRDVVPNVPQRQVVAQMVPNNQVGSSQDRRMLAAIDPHQIERPTREERLAAATAFRKRQLKNADLIEALTFMRSLPDGDAIDLDSPERSKHNFSESELDTVYRQSSTARNGRADAEVHG
jgi:hypothetical protein